MILDLNNYFTHLILLVTSETKMYLSLWKVWDDVNFIAISADFISFIYTF